MSFDPLGYNELRALRAQLQTAMDKIDAITPSVDAITASSVANLGGKITDARNNINTASTNEHNATRNTVNTKGEEVKAHVNAAVQTYSKGIKNVQRGTSVPIVVGAGTGTVTVNIAAVNPAKTYVNALSSYADRPVHISLSSASTLFIKTVDGGQAVNWEVIEWL